MQEKKLKRKVRLYNERINQEWSKYQKMLENPDYDVVLNPSESIPMPQLFADNLENKNWGLDYLSVNDYWGVIKAKKNKRNVLIVGFDTAGKLDHVDFDGLTMPGKSFTGEPLDDGHGHGTHIAGTITSKKSNVGVGAVLATEGLIKFLPAKILNYSHHQGNYLMHQEEEIYVPLLSWQFSKLF